MIPGGATPPVRNSAWVAKGSRTNCETTLKQSKQGSALAELSEDERPRRLLFGGRKCCARGHKL